MPDHHDEKSVNDLMHAHTIPVVSTSRRRGGLKPFGHCIVKARLNGQVPPA